MRLETLRGETQQLTHDGQTYRMTPVWSPDSKWITFTDQTGALYLVEVETKSKKLKTTKPSKAREARSS